MYGGIPKVRASIKKLGATSRDECIQNVTVVWVARSPHDDRLYVVGWYRNSTVHRDRSFRVPRPGGRILPCQVAAAVEDAVLLRPDERELEVPTAASGKGGIGQSIVWYGNPTFFARVRKLIAGRDTQTDEATKKAGKPKGAPKQPDPAKRKLIEDAAMAHASAYYESATGGTDVSKTSPTSARGGT